jgi:hypothetical protein
MKNIFKVIFIYAILISVNSCSTTSNNLVDLISRQKHNYPEITVQDVYKLLYQSVFGVKHLLMDTVMSKKYLWQEYESITPKDEPLFENISLDGSIVRINLKSFKHKNLSLEQLLKVMKLSAESINGDPSEFKKYWDEYERMVINKELSFNIEEIRKYREKITPHPPEEHHSEIYIQRYSPSYRVVKKELFLRYFPEIQ